MTFLSIHDAPAAFFVDIIRASSLGSQTGVSRVETVSSIVFFGTCRSLEWVDVRFYDSVLESVDHRVKSIAEDMLVIVCVDVWGNSRSVWIRFVISANVDLKDTGKANVDFNGSILVEVIIPDVLCNADGSKLDSWVQHLLTNRNWPGCTPC